MLTPAFGSRRDSLWTAYEIQCYSELPLLWQQRKAALGSLALGK